MVIKNHNLAKGIYSIDFNLGLKDINSGITDFDVIRNVVSFIVIYKNKEKQENGGGETCFRPTPFFVFIMPAAILLYIFFFHKKHAPLFSKNNRKCHFGH